MYTLRMYKCAWVAPVMPSRKSLRRTLWTSTPRSTSGKELVNGTVAALGACLAGGEAERQYGPRISQPQFINRGVFLSECDDSHQTQEHPQLRNGGQHYPSVSRTCIKCVFSCPMHGSFILPQKYASCLTLNWIKLHSGTFLQIPKHEPFVGLREPRFSVPFGPELAGSGLL